MDFRIHHVAISVTDMHASKAFYGELGFREVMSWAAPGGSPQIVHLKLGETLLELFRFNNYRPAPGSAAELKTDLPRVGAKHFALEVDSVEQAKDFVQDRGWATEVEIVEGKTGVRYFFIHDPSGILLEFVEDRRDIFS
ncbi:MAG: VOC family protein [Actinomycetota bacterium]